jgi:hypothetical protein
MYSDMFFLKSFSGICLWKDTFLIWITLFCSEANVMEELGKGNSNLVVGCAHKKILLLLTIYPSNIQYGLRELWQLGIHKVHNITWLHYGGVVSLCSMSQVWNYWLYLNTILTLWVCTKRLTKSLQGHLFFVCFCHILQHTLHETQIRFYYFSQKWLTAQTNLLITSNIYH